MSKLVIVCWQYDDGKRAASGRGNPVPRSVAAKIVRQLRKVPHTTHWVEEVKNDG